MKKSKDVKYGLLGSQVTGLFFQFRKPSIQNMTNRRLKQGEILSCKTIEITILLSVTSMFRG
jgi:hypothetical protein